jgi:phosphate starvation-inducible PhoH-like protein
LTNEKYTRFCKNLEWGKKRAGNEVALRDSTLIRRPLGWLFAKIFERNVSRYYFAQPQETDKMVAMNENEATVAVIDSKALLKVFGPSDTNLRRIREALGVKVTLDGNKMLLRGTADAVRRGSYLLEQLQRSVLCNGHLETDDIQRAISEVVHGKDISNSKPIDVYNGKQIRAKTDGQARYVELLRNKAIVICIGPAGTGKTYLAVAKAVEALKTDAVRKIVLVRPAVEAGESLGFLPGDLQAKINPYLRPLFDALGDMVDRDMLKRYMEEDRIEVIPLAYMRGRTLNNASII